MAVAVTYALAGYALAGGGGWAAEWVYGARRGLASSTHHLLLYLFACACVLGSGEVGCHHMA